MSTIDTCCTIVPYFKVPANNMAAFKTICEQFVEKPIPKLIVYIMDLVFMAMRRIVVKVIKMQRPY
jgi:hypothetical protein